MEYSSAKVINKDSAYYGETGLVEYCDHNGGYPIVKLLFDLGGTRFFFLDELEFVEDNGLGIEWTHDEPYEDIKSPWYPFLCGWCCGTLFWTLIYVLFGG